MLNLTHSSRFSREVDRFSNFIFRGIKETPCVESDPSAPIVIYSVLGKRHVNPYLLALKSFMRFFPDLPMSVVVQDDGSLDNGSLARLQQHVHGITVWNHNDSMRSIRDSMGKSLTQVLPPLDQTCFFLPLKLLNILYRFPNRYVILLDSDLLFLKEPEDVRCGLESEAYRNFHSPGGNGLSQQFRAMNFEFGTVEIERFNAGFFGFLNTLSEDDLLPVVSRIAEYDVSLFSNWEIEQAIWSVLLNRGGESLCLKDISETYVGSGWRTYEELVSQAVLVHFVGSTRFRNWTYPRLARQVMIELRAADNLKQTGAWCSPSEQQTATSTVG